MANRRPAIRTPLPAEVGEGPSWLAVFIVGLFQIYPVLAILLFLKFRAMHNKKRLGTWRQILNVVGNKPYINLRVLAKAVGLSRKELIKVLKEMIYKNYLGSEAHIDHYKDMLVLDAALDDIPSGAPQRDSAPFGINLDIDLGDIKDIASDIVRTIKSTFQMEDDIPEAEYTRAEPTWESAAPEAEAAQEEPAAQESGDAGRSEHQDTLDKLRILNEQIMDEEVSRKIDRIMAITDDIYDVVEKDPTRANEVRKFINYYLPTTMKLLSAYGIMERQRYQGENIQASMKNIEAILDTLVHVFEKQLDMLFAADAVDISSDIRVLETMIAKDGLSQQQMQLNL